MKQRFLRSIPPLALLVLAVAASALLLAQRHGSAQSPTAAKVRQKNLRDIAKERDVVWSGGSHPVTEYSTFEELVGQAKAVVYGRIVDSRSLWDESGHPVEHGENITTEYTVEVLRVVRDKTRSDATAPGALSPAPLTTPLKIARDGGIVYENGHRAEVKYKGYESLKPGKPYVFFLFWSKDYKAYVMAGGLSGAVMVEDDRSLKPLASSEDIREKLRGADLESLITQVLNSN